MDFEFVGDTASRTDVVVVSRHNNNRHALQRKRHLRQQMEPKCHWCGCVLTAVTATLEHLIPLSLAGSRSFWNTTLACGPCNNERGHVQLPPTLMRLQRRRRKYGRLVEAGHTEFTAIMKCLARKVRKEKRLLRKQYRKQASGV